LPYGLQIVEYTKYVSFFDISIAVFTAYLAELFLAQGNANDVVNDLLNISEQNASKAPCDSELRINVLADIYLFRSINAKAQRNTSEAWYLLDEVQKSRWVKKYGNEGLFVPLTRQKVMMTQSLQQHLILLGNASNYREQNPIEYFGSIKRVFEFMTNQGHPKSVQVLKPVKKYHKFN